MTIPQNKIILSGSEKLKYYSFPIWTFGIFVFMTIINWNEYIENPESNTLLKISFIIILLGMISLIIKVKNLKLIKINHNWNQEELKTRLRLLSTKENWKIDILDNEKIIFTKTRIVIRDKYFMNKSRGEKIFLYYSNKEIKFKSILYSENNSGFSISSGENKMNEKLISNCVKPTANTV